MQRGQCAFFSLLSWGSTVYKEYREPSTSHPVISFMMMERRAGVGLLLEFPYAFEDVQGEASNVLFASQVAEGVCVSSEDDGRGHAW